MLQWANLFRLSTLLLCVNLFGFPVKDYAQTDLNRNGGHGNTDLQLTKAVDRLSARVGTRIMFTVQLKNIGIKRAEDVIVTDLLPSGFSFAGSSNPQRYNSSTGRWTIKDLRAGDSISLQILAVVNPITPASNFTNLAYISQSDGIDPDKKNDTARVAVAVYDFSVNSSTICANTSARLQAGAVNVVNPVFKWYADQGLTQLIFTGAVFQTPALLTDQSYYVVVNGDNIPPPGIADALVASVTVQPSPIAPAVALVQPDCINPTGIITVSTPLVAGNKFSIDGITFNNTTGVFPRVLPGNYAVYIQSANGCISPSTTVMIAAAPVTPVAPSLTVVQPTCSTGTGSITVSSPRNPGFRYSIDGVDYSDSTGIFRQLAPGTYNVAVKSNGGCVSGVVTAVIEQNPLIPAAPVLTVVQPVCPSPTGSITVTSPVGSGYTYSIDGNTYSNQTGIFTSLLPGSYQVSVKNANGCVGASTLAVVEPPVLNDPVLTISASGSTELCAGGTVVLTASGTGIFQWFKYGIPIAGAQSASFTASSEGVFTVSRRSADGCYSRQSEGVLVTVAAPITQPVLYADKLSICSGDSVVLMAGITGSVQWSKDGIPIDTTSTNILTVKEGGIYTIRSLSSGGCEGSVSNPVPVRVLSRPDKPLLEVLQPTCTASGQIKITSPLGSGYLYTIDRTAYNNASGLFTGVLPGTYGVGVKSLNGCVSTVTEAIIKSVAIIDTLLSITASKSTDLCVGETVTLTAGNAESYQWFQNGFAIAGANDKTYEVKGEGIYAVARRNIGTCVFPLSAGVPVRIVLPPAAPVIATAKQLICAGETVQLQSSQAFALQWFRNGQPLPGATGVQLTVQSSGTYTAISLNSAGCSSAFSNPLVITVVAKPAAPVLEIDGTTQFCKDETRLLRILTIPPAHSIQWYRNNTLIPLVFTDTLRVSDGATYRVTFTNNNGCISDFSNAIVTAVVCVTGIYVPDVFTPNGDGVNDVIRPITPGIKKFKWFRIYNRWGNLVFESADAQKAWDGKFRGQDQPAETYIWVVEGADSRGMQIKKSGMLNLVR